eukprot:466382-Prymnesium_polylepis.1
MSTTGSAFFVMVSVSRFMYCIMLISQCGRPASAEPISYFSLYSDISESRRSLDSQCGRPASLFCHVVEVEIPKLGNPAPKPLALCSARTYQ